VLETSIKKKKRKNNYGSQRGGFQNKNREKTVFSNRRGQGFNNRDGGTRTLDGGGNEHESGGERNGGLVEESRFSKERGDTSGLDLHL